MTAGTAVAVFVAFVMGELWAVPRAARVRHLEAESRRGCDCAGWVNDSDSPTPGRPAEPWFAVWVNDNAISVDPLTRRPNAIYEHVTPLKVRPLTNERCPA